MIDDDDHHHHHDHDDDDDDDGDDDDDDDDDGDHDHDDGDHDHDWQNFFYGNPTKKDVTLDQQILLIHQSNDGDYYVGTIGD